MKDVQKLPRVVMLQVITVEDHKAYAKEIVVANGVVEQHLRQFQFQVHQAQVLRVHNQHLGIIVHLRMIWWWPIQMVLETMSKSEIRAILCKAMVE